MIPIAIIGAGMAGLACARQLAPSGRAFLPIALMWLGTFFFEARPNHRDLLRR
jgi:uncharacterized protein with NAD-binding domain and iron-sulfur cluster